MNSYICIHGCLRSVLLAITGFIAITFSHSMDDFTGKVFPANHALNAAIDSLPVHSNSQNFINSMGANTSLHPDFGTQWEEDGIPYQMGIPYNVVGANQPLVPITFNLYDDESDPGPWPIPRNPFIETVFDWRDTAEGDRHMLIIDTSRQMLYETGNVTGNSDGTVWQGGCGAVFDLNSNELRKAGWTSADAAGLPVFPLLVRYDEISRAMENGGVIPHAIRVTASRTQKAYIWPARHFASSSTDTNRPPMGLRFRLKKDYDISGFSSRMQIILRTFKKYGLIMADNGSNWYFQGTHDDRWDDEEINSLKKLHGSDFEVVDISSWMKRSGFDPNSAAVPSVTPILNSSASFLNHHKLFLVQKIHNNQYEIHYSLVKSGLVEIRLDDLQARNLQIITRDFKTAGEHCVSFSVKLTPGLYLIILRFADVGMKTQRFVITR
ncbi:MAG TPA: hypothetical protein VHP36_06485 [Chitinispirillaceae bacterium]|nr:hypothetical protein [Chitinispirillaceae bacterium]